MRTFKSLNIEVSPPKTFVGNKIKVTKILNREIKVLDYTIGPSKHFKGDCLQMQIEYKEVKYVVFTSATGLIEAIKQVPRNNGDLSFKTTIVDDNDRYLFT